MPTTQPYYVLPVLNEQPTWGGEYIAAFKSLNHPALAGKNIGQSFELAAASRLLPTLPTEPTFGLATGSDVSNPTWYGAVDAAIPLSDVIPGEFNTLIKFTQAQNNSYQVHVKPGAEFGQWQAKPESWYFMERGKATLGLAAGADPAAYQKRCQEIEAEASRISQAIKAGALSVEAGREQLAAFIDKDHPRRFVNTVWLEPHQTVDLSQGGVHHSWEKDPELPAGNIIYEVQIDVLDQFCSMRAFDQGNIKDDGSVRPITIDDYFRALDSSPLANEVDQYVSTPESVPFEGGEYCELFTTQWYRSYILSLKASYQGEYTLTGESFHHLFTTQGEVTVICEAGEYPVPKGWSVLLPPGHGQYQLAIVEPSQVIVTTR